MQAYTKPEIVEVLAEVLEDNRHIFNKWLSRGDGIAVYENKLIEAPVKAKKGEDREYALADRQFVSFGSPAAQIESAEPPARMPDIGGQINWRYQLVGTYKGECV